MFATCLQRVRHVFAMRLTRVWESNAYKNGLIAHISLYLEIQRDRFLTASVYRDELLVHIREYDSSYGQMYPTKKVVTFTKPRWAKFVGEINEIDRNVELLKANQPVDYLQHLGGKYHVSIF